MTDENASRENTTIVCTDVSVHSRKKSDQGLSTRVMGKSNVEQSKACWSITSSIKMEVVAMTVTMS